MDRVGLSVWAGVEQVEIKYTEVSCEEVGRCSAFFFLFPNE